ncbi:uncharacterized protein LOC134681559 [Mytilus trossulus]|uniref:uncharacterized protein LOC134681559 n=1 Tax=Mytilus trossulus TaxID=6551 RepID=UPI0030071D6A
MMYLMALLVLLYCKITQGVLEWTVVGKVTDYGQNVTLFCNVSHCCPDDAGWDRWTPVQQTLFIDVKSGGGENKYDGKVLRDGYTLIIQNLTKDDLNVSYSCLYGVTLGERKFLQKEDVFSYPSYKQYNVPIGSSSQAAGKITGITIGVVFVVGTVVGFLIFYKTRTKALKDKMTRPDQECGTNSNMSNDEQDVQDDNQWLLSKTLIKGEIDSHKIHSSDLKSSVSIDGRPEVMGSNPVLLKRQLFPAWPTENTYSLSYMQENTKTQLMENVQMDRMIYDTDPKQQCRVLCILNEKSKDKIVYYSQSYMDDEYTILKMMGEKLGWHLMIHRNKSSSEINTILDEETKYDYKSVRVLFVIIVSSGDQSGIYGTIGEKIQYDEITTKFQKVPCLMDKPKIFILDYYDIEIDTHYQKQVLQDQYDMMDGAGVPNQNVDIKMGKVPTEGLQYEVCTTDEHHPNRTNEGRKILVTNSYYKTVSNQHLDTYKCIAQTLGRCDKIVKGSWVIGALLSVICEAGHYMTFTEMMKEVQIMVTEAVVPEGKPEPEIKIEDCLSKDFYLLPPSP